MNKRGFRRVAVFASAATLAGGAIAGCGSWPRATPAAVQGPVSSRQGQPPQGGGGMDVSALADALGVTEGQAASGDAEEPAAAR